MEDCHGYIWAYTDNGIARFDGYEFKTYNLKNGLGSNDVWLLSEGSQGRLFCFSYSPYLSWIENNKAHKKRIRVNRSSVFLSEEKGALYTGDKDYLFRKIISFTKEGAKMPDSVSALPVYKLQNFGQDGFAGWINSSTYYSYGNQRFYILNQDLDTINQIFNIDLKFDKALEANFNYKNTGFVRNPFMGDPFSFRNLGNLLLRISPTKVDVFDAAAYLNYFGQAGVSFSLNKASSDMVYTDGWGHVLKLDSNFKYKDSYDYSALNNKHPNSRGFIDTKGNVWVNTLSSGLFFLAQTKRKVKSKELTIKQKMFTPSFIKWDGKKYLVGTETGALFSWDKKIIKLISQGSATEYKDFIKFDDKNLVAQAGLYWEQNGRLLPYLHHKEYYTVHDNKQTPEFYRNPVYKSIEKKDKRSFFVANTAYVLHAGLGKKKMKVIAQLRASDLEYIQGEGLFIASDKGLLFWDEQKNKIKNIQEEKLNIQINKIVRVKDKLYLATNGLGVMCYHIPSDSLTTFHAVKGELIADIYMSTDTKAYIASKKGLEYVDLQKDKRLAQISTANALPNNDVKCVALQGDTLLVGSPAGISLVPLSIIKDHATSSAVLLNKVLLNNQEIEVSKLQSLATNENNLSISYSNLDYARIPDVNYYYRLQEKDVWKQTNKNILNFEKLASGNYTFQIYAAGNEKNILSVPISIATPFYKSAWFYALLALLVILLFYWQFKQREKKQRALLQKENEINQRIAELELSALQSQMNPHFIFNSLGSIQYYQRQNIELADEYLGKFARLMRLFLESSKKQYNTLEEELKLIGLYLEMEQLRLGEKLSVELSIADDLDPTVDELPSMIVQPFVENAINHGIFHKEGNGKVSVHFSMENEQFIKVIVQDNGIGRARAEEIKKKSLKTHTSRAMQIVQEKLDVLQESNNFKVGFEIEDLFNEQNEASGTKATLLLPS